MQFPPIEIIFNLHPPIREVCAIKLFYSRRLSCFLCHCSHLNLALGSDTSCMEFNQNPNMWETKQIEKTHAKENNHTHKTIFTWFGNLPTSTELQGFHYYQGKYNSAQDHCQKPNSQLHLNSLTLLHLLGYWESLLFLSFATPNHIYIDIYVKSANEVPITNRIRSTKVT